MSYFSIRTNDQNTIQGLLDESSLLSISGLTWHQDDVNIEDTVFIIVSGDNSKKIIPYENGLRAIGKVVRKPYDVKGKTYSIDIDVVNLFDESITKDDFYIYPTLKNVGSIGPETKQAPNQAIRKLTNEEGIEVIASLKDMGFVNSFIGDIPSTFSLKKLKFATSSLGQPVNHIINSFIIWFNKQDNFVKSYEGLVNYEYLSFVDDCFFDNQLFEIKPDNIKTQIGSKLALVRDKTNKKWNSFNASTSKGAPSAVLGNNNYIKFLKEKYNIDKLEIVKPIKKNLVFSINKFIVDIEASNLYFKPQLVTRFVASLITKPFVLLNGLSGSGKTKLAQAFVQWICQEESQYKIIPVGADWTNREPLLGYPDGLNPKMYVTPDNGALQLILDAQENNELPYFMILDEMNLSHVERYFADFLSIMESDDSIKLYTGNKRKSTEGREIPDSIQWPKNLFIIGTVNIDETTYMFSPKVLDRANVIEFRLSERELQSFFKLTDTVNLEALVSEGAGMSNSFLELAKSELRINDKTVQDEILSFFSNLSKVGAEFGYRTANEVLQLIHQLGELDNNLSVEAKVDIAVMQKLLPKLHGSRSKLVKVLEALVILCLDNSDGFEISKGEVESDNIKYPLSYAKLVSMYRNVIANGFTSYAEA